MLTLMEYVVNTRQMVVHYAAMSMRPNLKDRVLSLFFPQQTATTVLSTVSALALQKSTAQYTKSPSECHHPQGLRSYGAGGKQVRICDLCGSRWIVDGREFQKVLPKASPTSSTPLFAKASKAKPKAVSSKSLGVPASGWPGFLPSSPPSSHPSYTDRVVRPSQRPPMSPPPKSTTPKYPATSCRPTASRMEEIYNKRPQDLTEEEIGLLHSRLEDFQEFNIAAEDLDFENGEAEYGDHLYQHGLWEDPNYEEEMDEETRSWLERDP